MINKILSLFKERLTTVGSEEPLNKLSLAVIIILDLFVLNILFYGLAEHTKQLTSPGDYMPSNVRQIFIDQSWSPANRISKLQPLILADRNNTRYRYESPFAEQKIKLMHPAGREFYEKTRTLAADRDLHAVFLSRQKTVEERSKTESAFDRAKKSYDTQLLENIANGAKPGSNATSTTAQQYAQKIDRLTGQIRSLEQQINAHPGIQTLWKFITPNDDAREEIVADYKRFQFWFPLKELLWQLVFLLPIFGIFYVWSVRSVKRDNRIQTLIASHMLVIASLPIIVKIIKLVIDLIPNHFFRNLFKFLESLHLIAIWHYVVIIGSIALGLFLIFLIQKKVFSKQKVMQKRLMKGDCIRCSKKLPAKAAICPFCGTNQLTKCSACDKETPTAGIYCIHCGSGRKEAD